MSVTESILCDLKDAMSVPSSSGCRTGFTGTAVGLTVQLTVQRWSLEHLLTESRLLVTCKIPCLFLLLLSVEPGSVFLFLLCVEPGSVFLLLCVEPASVSSALCRTRSLMCFFFCSV